MVISMPELRLVKFDRRLIYYENKFEDIKQLSTKYGWFMVYDEHDVWLKATEIYNVFTKL